MGRRSGNQTEARSLSISHKTRRIPDMRRPPCFEAMRPTAFPHSSPSPLYPLPPPDPQPITRRIVQVLFEAQVALGGLDGGMPQGNLDLLERRAAEVGELGEGSPQIMWCDLAQPGLTGVGDDRLEDPLGGVSGPSPTRPALPTRRSTAPEEIPAAVAQRSRASLAQDGIGTVRTRPCLPTRSTIAQRPSRCATSGNSSPASSPLRSPHPTNSPSKTRSRRPLIVSGSGSASSRWACCRVSQLPVRTPDRRAPGTPRIPAAARGESSPWAAASAASLRRAASERLIEAAESPRSMRCER